jgi:pentatricopeptide repeat protein
VEDALISNIRRHRKHFGSRTGETLDGGSRDGCNGTRHRTIAQHIFAWNKKLTKYVKGGQTEKAMQLFQQMQ